jgi:Cytotoxic
MVEKAQGKFCESPSLSPIWNNFDRYQGKTRRDKDRLFEWDNLHGDIEVYNKRGEHLGSMNPFTGEMHKGPVKGRTLN